MVKKEIAPRIVIRRPKRVKHEHHGGAWKIAYADFITAMMAFFLIMWILALVPKENLGEMAQYFKRPLIEAVQATHGTGQDRSLIPGKSPSVIPNPNPLPTPQIAPEVRAVTPQGAGGPNAAEREDAQRLEDLKSAIERLIDTDPVLSEFRPQMLLDMTPEGLRIQIVDQQNRPMFQSGKATVQPYMQTILRQIAPLFNALPNAITLSGHTDATPYIGGDRAYSNWELSSDRAHAARQELMAGGLESNKVKRVLGLGPTVSLIKDNPYAPVNRRISVLVLNAKTEARMDSESSTEAFSIGAQGEIIRAHIRAQ